VVLAEKPVAGFTHISDALLDYLDELALVYQELAEERPAEMSEALPPAGVC
jgi:hypothetical protein